MVHATSVCLGVYFRMGSVTRYCPGWIGGYWKTSSLDCLKAKPFNDVRKSHAEVSGVPSVPTPTPEMESETLEVF